MCVWFFRLDVGTFDFNYLLLQTTSSSGLGADECRPMIHGDGGICLMLLVSVPLLERGRKPFGFIVCFTDGCFCPVRLSSPYGGIRRAHFGDWMNLTPAYWTQSGHRCRTKTRSRRVRNAPDSAGQTGTGYPYPRPLVLAQKCGRYVYRSFHPNNMLRTISPTMIPLC